MHREDETTRTDALEEFKHQLARRVPSLWLEDARSPEELAERIAKELGRR